MNDKRINWGPEMTAAERETFDAMQDFQRDVVQPAVARAVQASERNLMRNLLCGIIERLGGELVFDADELDEMVTRQYDLKVEYDPNFMSKRIKVTRL
jgi:hypothetical protein